MHLSRLTLTSLLSALTWQSAAPEHFQCFSEELGYFFSLEPKPEPKSPKLSAPFVPCIHNELGCVGIMPKWRVITHTPLQFWLRYIMLFDSMNLPGGGLLKCFQCHVGCSVCPTQPSPLKVCNPRGIRVFTSLKILHCSFWPAGS